MRQPKTEKQIEARRLYSEIVFVPMTVHKTRPYKYNPDQKETRTDDIHLCDINGRRFIKISDIPGLYTQELLTKMVEEGKIPRTDIIHTRAKTPAFGIVALDTILKHQNEIIERSDIWSMEKWNAVIETANEAEYVGIFQISEEKLAASEAAYCERLRLISENSREKRQHNQQEAIAETIAEAQQQNAAQPTLQELVDQIEAMGWEVTLRRKADDNVR